ncbi:MAG: hydrogenase maturation nickel metallochaperone HypA [Acidobacteriia bacterium]|nr:hydrogenase maturation nickel metallochaperone HypA [Terriglobia bacterium]
MHELSIAQGIVDIIGQYVPEDQAPEVRLVKVRVGRLAGVVPDSLDFCFGAIVSGTSLGLARLAIEETPIQSRCTGCGEIFAVEGAAFLCPGCGSAEIKIISGTELQVVEIELLDRQAETV